MRAARAQLESLLRSRKLDGTLTTATGRPEQEPDDRLVSTGWGTLDRALGGGLRRGHLSEVTGTRSSGRSAIFNRLAASVTAGGEVVALIDAHDRFDPVSACAAGVDLANLLWIRDTGQADRAVKAMHLVLQAGNFGMVALDLADARDSDLRQFPHTTWMRLARAIEGSRTVALLIGSSHMARSAGGATIVLESAPAPAGEWCGTTARGRRLGGLSVRPRVIAGRAW